MGVRLYPNTQDVVRLEVLAGVPAGTMDRLTAMEARQKDELEKAPREERYELGYKHYQERNDDAAMGDLDAFMTFGWGKFNGGEDCCGSAEGEAAQALLNLNGINAEAWYCEGVHWC